jgi:hypothetical protein
MAYRKLKNIILQNESGNYADGEGLIVFGIGLAAIGKNKVVLGRYNNPLEESDDDALVIGGGTPTNRETSIRITRTGEILVAGGGYVYMDNPVTELIDSVYMLDNDGKIKQVTL